MSLDAVYADDIEANLQRWAANPPPPQEQGFSMTSFIGAGLKGVPAAVLEMSGGALDATSGYGNVMAATGGTSRGMFSLPNEDERKQEAEARKRMLAGDNQNVAMGNAVRRKADEFAPDPITANRADQVIFGLTRFGGKALGYVGAMGPAGAIPLGFEEGNTETQKLRLKGIDDLTATKVGAVQGVTSAVGAVMPLGGKTVLQTLGLVAVGGPGMFMAQEQTSRAILQNAGYRDEASLHNPFDPLGLVLSTVVPGAFGALHMRNVNKATPQLVDVVKHIESGGNPNAVGPNIPGQGTAKGEMQVMDATNADPGFGVTPAKDNSPEERARVGRDYLGAMVTRYGDQDKALAAYNAGPGTVDKAMATHGDSWLAHMPEETQKYVAKARKLTGDYVASEGAKNPEVVDAARVSVLNDTMQRNLPDIPDAYERVMRAADAVSEGSRVNESAPIPRADLLAPGDRAVEARLTAKLGDNFDAAVDEYAQRPDSMGGKVLNTDIARELSPEYLADRTRSAAVHEPASWFVKQLYERKLAQLQPGERVVFTSGGTGAGKTTAIQSVDAARQLQDGAALVYDTNMNSLGSAVSKIDKALAAGAEVHIVHVQRDPVEALVNGSLPRAMRQEAEFGSGRTVPLQEHARTHTGAAKVIDELAAKYADNPNVHIAVIDNTRGKGGAQLADLGFVRGFGYNDVEGNLHAALQQEFQAGRISEAVYRGSGIGQGLEPAARGVDGARPARYDGRQDAASPDFGEVSPKPAPTSPAGERGTATLDKKTADRLVAEQPDLLVRLPGSDENISVSRAIEQIAAEQKQDAQWADLLRVAVECSLTAA